MPNIKSAKKRLRQNERLRAANKSRKSEMWTMEKKFQAAVAAGDKVLAMTALSAVSGKLDKAVKNHIIHANKADRKKSRLAATLNAMA